MCTAIEMSAPTKCNTWFGYQKLSLVAIDGSRLALNYQTITPQMHSPIILLTFTFYKNNLESKEDTLI